MTCILVVLMRPFPTQDACLCNRGTSNEAAKSVFVQQIVLTAESGRLLVIKHSISASEAVTLIGYVSSAQP